MRSRENVNRVGKIFWLEYEVYTTLFVGRDDPGAKPRLKRTLIRPFGPPSPWKGEGPERTENRKTFPP